MFLDVQGGLKVRTQRFVYYKPCIAYQRVRIMRRVVISFKQDVQCVRRDLQSRVLDDIIDHQQRK